MSKLTIENVVSKERNVNEFDLKEINALISKHTPHSNPMSLLSPTPWYEASFEIKNSYPEFANGIRRILIEELPVKSLQFEDSAMETNDPYMLIEYLRTTLSMVPILQDVDMSKYHIYLSVSNNTNKKISVKSGDIKLYLKSDKKKNPVNSNKLLNLTNINIFELGPNCTLRIKEITITEGYAKNNAAAFSLLDNISYSPIGLSPYDIFQMTGVRTAVSSPKDFRISFKTAGNISLSYLFNLLADTFIARLNDAKEKVSVYNDQKTKDEYYITENFEVIISEGEYSFKFYGEYITMAFMLAKKCYLLDPSILFCAPTINRYDDEIGIVRMNHPDASGLLLKAIDECIEEVEILRTIWD